MLKRRKFIAGLGSGLFAHTVAFAQQSDRVRIIGSLALGATRPDDPIYEAIRKGLRERGYVEGRDFRIEHRTAEGRQERLPALAQELVRLKADVIVTGNDETTRIAKQTAGTIPIVALLYNHDPIASGFIKSFNHPGGNITGLTVRNSELAGKRLELLKEMMPSLARLAVFWDTPAQDELEALKLAARTLAVHLQVMDMTSQPDFHAMFKAAKSQKADAVMILHAPLFYVNRVQLGALALANRMPTSAAFRDIKLAGGLISYSTDVRDQYYRGAYFIDRLLKGTKPSELPFEETARIELVINQKTAKSLGINLPESILLRADEVIR